MTGGLEDKWQFDGFSVRSPPTAVAFTCRPTQRTPLRVTPQSALGGLSLSFVGLVDSATFVEVIQSVMDVSCYSLSQIPHDPSIEK